MKGFDMKRILFILATVGLVMSIAVYIVFPRYPSATFVRHQFNYARAKKSIFLLSNPTENNLTVTYGATDARFDFAPVVNYSGTISVDPFSDIEIAVQHVGLDKNASLKVMLDISLRSDPNILSYTRLKLQDCWRLYLGAPEHVETYIRWDHDDNERYMAIHGDVAPPVSVPTP
jgi:hypothetical protein